MVTDSNDKPTSVSSTLNHIPEDASNKFLAGNLKIVDPDVGQTHTCQGIGPDKDRLVFQTEANGNVSMYVLPKKFNLDYEKSKQVSGKFFLVFFFPGQNYFLFCIGVRCKNSKSRISKMENCLSTNLQRSREKLMLITDLQSV